MTAVETRASAGTPEQGNLVRVRDRFWVVESVIPSRLLPTTGNGDGTTAHNAVRLVPVDDKGSPDPLTVYWELEPGTEIRPQASLPDPADGLDDSETFGAFLNAARWGAVAAADPTAFQSPFRAGIDINDYQLLPLVKALAMPRVSLLIADDVGLGKTIEAGLIAEELVLRGQVRILERLLELNRDRYLAEVEAGLHGRVKTTSTTRTFAPSLLDLSLEEAR